MTSDLVLEPWQFNLSKTPAPDAIAVGGFYLRCGPDIHAVHLHDSAGVFVGVVFGFPIDLPGKKVLTDDHHLDFALGADLDVFAEQVLRALGGRFVWICAAPEAPRIYLDCAGLVPCVYDPDLQIAGTTATALLDDDAYESRFDNYLYNRLRVGVDGFIPAGHTAHTGLKRLLPNHYLDLNSWTAHRHWPTGDIPQVADPREAIAEIITIVRDQIEALIGADKRVAQALTAGHETRMLLGVARPFLEQVDFVTVVGSDRHAVDSIMARRIAAGEGLNHRELPRKTADEAARNLFIRRGGNCVVDSNSYYAPSVAPIARSHNFVGGLGGELARAFFWQADDKPDLEITPSRLLGRFGQPDEAQLHPALADWLDHAPTDNALSLLDLAYVEHRMGPWSGGQFCNDPTLVRYAPLFTRRSSELMLGLPPDWKIAERMSSEAVAQTWPELANYPYNFVSNWHSFSVKAYRVLQDPWVVVRRLRKTRK